MHLFKVLLGLMGMHIKEDDVSFIVMEKLIGRKKVISLSTTKILAMFLFHVRLLRIVSSLEDFMQT